MNASELMSKPVYSCSTRDTLNTAAQLMWEHDLGAVPVLDEEGGMVGIVTDRDVCMAAYTQGKPLSEIPITSPMAKVVFSVHGDESIERAERLMREHQIRRVPVVNGQNRPIGMLSLNDLARDATRSGHGKDETKVVQTLAAVCQGRGPALRAA